VFYIHSYIFFILLTYIFFVLYFHYIYNNNTYEVTAAALQCINPYTLAGIQTHNLRKDGDALINFRLKTVFLVKIGYFWPNFSPKIFLKS
jgi:hypothetical protein